MRGVPGDVRLRQKIDDNPQKPDTRELQRWCSDMQRSKSVVATIFVATLAVGQGGSASADDLDLGRVLAYSFDSWTTSTLALDASGKGNHGTPVNFDQPPVTEPGHAGDGLSLVFDRFRQQRLDVGTGAQRSLDLRAFTIAAWTKIAESDTDEKNWEIAEKAAAYWLNVRNGHDSRSAAYRLRCGMIINGIQYTVTATSRFLAVRGFMWPAPITATPARLNQWCPPCLAGCVRTH
jgi:hypothetical protein